MEEAEKIAKEEFDKVFGKKEIPSEILEYGIQKQAKIIDILTQSKLIASKNEARRLIKQQAVSFENEKISGENFIVAKTGIIKVGSRRYLKVILNPALS